MSGYKKGIIWRIDRNKLQNIVSEEDSISGVLRKLNYKKMGTYYFQSFKNRCNQDNIDYSHFQLNNKGRKFPNKAKPLKEVMIENSTYSRSNLKKRLLKDGILKNECAICGLQPFWKGKPLVMVLDHINGISDDHRLENLRLLCSNCNSQTDTFVGKKFHNQYRCKKCNIKIHKTSTYCKKCAPKFAGPRMRKIERPSKGILQQDISTMPMTSVGKKYGVSDNCIRKWAKDCGIILERKHFLVPEKTCPFCNKVFKNDNRKQIYCSRKCAVNSRKNKIPKDKLINIILKNEGIEKASKYMGIGKTTLRELLKSYNIPIIYEEIYSEYAPAD